MRDAIIDKTIWLLTNNGGQITGNVALAASDTLTNTGTVHGNVALGASDTVNSNGGAITGVSHDRARHAHRFTLRARASRIKVGEALQCPKCPLK
jgi:hypothetical protein